MATLTSNRENSFSYQASRQNSLDVTSNDYHGSERRNPWKGYILPVGLAAFTAASFILLNHFEPAISQAIQQAIPQHPIDPLHFANK